MNHLSIVESWIFHEMLSDATLNGIINGRIYLGVADQEAGALFTVVSYVDASPFYNLGTKRDFSHSYYDFVVWQRGRVNQQMKAAANRIDVLFSAFRGRSFTQSGETFSFTSKLERSISRMDYSEPTEIWRGLGGTYKISATKTA